MHRRALVLAVGPVVLAVAAGLLLASRAPDPVVRTLSLGQARSVVVDARTGRAFVITGDTALSSSGSGSPASIRVLDTATGTLLRTVPIQEGGEDAPALDARTGRLFVLGVTNASASVSTLDARDGHVVRTISLDVSPMLPVAMALDQRGGRVFVAGFGFGTCTATWAAGGCGRVSVLDATSGRLLRAFIVPAQIGFLAVDERANHLIMAGGDPGSAVTVGVLDATGGRLLRSIPIGQTPSWPQPSPPLIVDETTGRAFVIGITPLNRGTVYVIDTRSGALLRADPMASLPISMALDERRGRMYVVTTGPITQVPGSPGPSVTQPGALSVLDARSGAVLRTVTVGVAATAVAVDARRGRVYVASAGRVVDDNAVGPGAISVVDARSGAVVRTLPTGVFPVAIALDDRAERAIVVSRGGAIRTTDAWSWLPGWLRRALPFIPRDAGQTRAEPGTITVINTSQ